MSDTVDPDERFKLDMEPDEALRRILDGEGATVEDVEPEPEDEPEEG